VFGLKWGIFIFYVIVIFYEGTCVNGLYPFDSIGSDHGLLTIIDEVLYMGHLN
jgi:hypothetical protein